MSRPSFIENIAAGVDALGLTHAPTIWGLAKVDWESPEDRDTFLRVIAKDR